MAGSIHSIPFFGSRYHECHIPHDYGPRDPSGVLRKGVYSPSLNGTTSIEHQSSFRVHHVMSSPEVYQGFWRNYSVGGIWGWTWTLSTSRGNNLLVFLGIYLGFVGGAFWSIIAFIIYQLMAGKLPRDGIHHQILLVLRNTSSPLSASREFATIAYYWRSVELRPRLMVPLLLSLPPLLIGIGFIVAGIEATRVSAGASKINEIKIKAGNCGLSQWDASNSTTGSIHFAFWLAKTAKDARAYVEDCYGNSSIQQIPYVCTYAVEQIRYAVSSDQPCPFEAKLCVGEPDSSFSMDTHLLDSHLILGINAPKTDRVYFRKSVTCSVLDHTDFFNSTTVTNTEGSNTTALYLLFGQNAGYNYTFNSTYSSVSDSFGYEFQ